MADTFLNDQEKQIKILKRRLEGWRVALLPLKSILLWEERWYPGVIIGAVTLLYLIIWLIDPNVLTSIASIGILINFIDFIVPIISCNLCAPTSWTGQKEKMFEEMCRSIVFSYNKAFRHVKSFYAMRESSPRMYYILSIGILSLLAWIGSSVDNAFLLYLVSMALLLWPGLQHRGLPQHCLSKIWSITNDNVKGSQYKQE